MFSLLSLSRSEGGGVTSLTAKFSPFIPLPKPFPQKLEHWNDSQVLNKAKVSSVQRSFMF